MARLITIYWRDIPARLVARRGRNSIRTNLSPRFQRAINRAALRAGKGSSQDYIDDWRRESVDCDADVQRATDERINEIESSYSDERLDQLAKNSGRERPADTLGDETST